LEAPVPTRFTHEGQMWCAIGDPRYTLTCQIWTRSVYSVALFCWLRISCISDNRKQLPEFRELWSGGLL